MPLHPARRVTENAAALFMGRLLVMALSFVFLLSAARVLGVEGFGRYALIRTYFDLLLSISATGLSLLITREIAKAPASAPVYLGAAAPLALGVAVLFGGSLILLLPVTGYGPDVRALLWLACLALVPASLAVLSEAVFVAIEKAHYVMWGTFGEGLLYTGIGLVLLWLGYGIHSLFIVLVATRICLALAYATVLYRQFGHVYRRSSWVFMKELCRDWRLFAVENWLVNLTASIDVVVLSAFHREAEFGLYAAAGKIVNFGAPLVASFTSAMFPYMSRLYGESTQAFRRVSEESLKYMLAAAFPGVVAIAMFADLVIVTLYGEVYAAAVPVLRIVIWVFVLNFVNPFLSHLLFARGETAKSLRVAAVTFVVFLGLCLSLVPRWGAVGAASALLATRAVACVLYSAAAFRPQPARVLIMFGRTGIAAASLAAFLALWRHTHPAALTAGAFGVYIGALLVMRVPSPREFGAFLRGLS
jgi:O-antigen/teichoic acid export membrane protein